LNERIADIGKLQRQMSECQNIKQLVVLVKQGLKQMFNPQQLYIMLKAQDVCQVFKKREAGVTHTLTIDLGNILYP